MDPQRESARQAGTAVLMLEEAHLPLSSQRPGYTTPGSEPAQLLFCRYNQNVFTVGLQVHIWAHSHSPQQLAPGFILKRQRHQFQAGQWLFPWKPEFPSSLTRLQ